MQFKNLFALIAAALPMVLTVSLPAKPSAIPCEDPKHPCHTYSNFPDCSTEYIKTLEQCKITGCIKWIIDPLEHCKCDSPLHACNTYSKHADCSDEYIADLKECEWTGCINWIQDPLKHCETGY